MKNKGFGMIEASKTLKEVETFLETNKLNILTLVSKPDKELGFVDGEYIIKSTPEEIKAINKCINIRKYNK